MIHLTDTDALFIADPQNDFMPGGALGVPEGHAIFPALNPLTHRFRLVLISQDWHPANHMSFTERGGPWPPHCVQMTPGADFHPALDQSAVHLVVRKGYDSEREQYSAFDEILLGDMLKGAGVTRVFMGGVATEYCVHDSAVGALNQGLDVVVLTDCIMPIDVKPGDGKRAIEDLRSRGAEIVSSSEVG